MILGDIAGVAAVALIALGLRELRAEHRPTIPIPLLAGLVLAIAATRVGAHGPIMFLDLAAVLVGAGGFIWASRRRTTEQRRAVAMPDARRLASIPGVGGNPQSVALSPDGRRVLVSLVRGRGGGLVVVDALEGRVTGTVAGIRQPRGMAASPDGASVYVLSMSDNQLWRLDAHTLDVTGQAEVGRGPSASRRALTAAGSTWPRSGPTRWSSSMRPPWRRFAGSRPTTARAASP